MTKKPDPKLEAEAKLLEELDEEEIIAKLSPDDYWEWRCTVEEINSEKRHVTALRLKLQLMEKEIRIQMLEKSIFSRSVMEAEAKCKVYEEDAKDFYKRLETKYKIELVNCVIKDDFGVRKLAKEETQGG